ncbi:type II toxin-antitoxin system HicB family antitoxin [Salinisphaera japonica]|uniref:HicB family protein n=1 Tax=Salinisphaera japonica YTM-1 TaxID=1209778 RepID=A0A423Q2A7_9GAMM|nr:hypothetical protein [Salinisphaera japonica]ROO32801.1 hypothetical protein SAJA_00785 [Salinisphaera japonica YTM-1]|tara:strand:+ start:965 stop:1264 length:300 start_codon:yes stop_codon:yes gene_type:complete
MQLRCYAEGQSGDWQAICLDLDIAVQGETFDQVNSELREAITLFLEEVKECSQADQKRLLRRRAPLRMRLKYAWLLLKNNSDDNDKSERHEFSYPAALA